MARTSRKKAAPAAVAESPADDTSFNPAEFDATPTVAAIVQDVAAATHLPADMERRAAHETGHAPDHRSHAEAVGRREPIIQSGLSFHRNDLLAGVRQGEGFRLVGGRKIREGVIAFAEKPSAEVITTMKDAGFDWQPADKLWTHPVRADSAWQDRAHAEATFDAASKAIRAERGIEHTVGVTA